MRDIDRFQDWYINGALPLWAGAGVDALGGFYESLDFDGRPIAGQARRVRVQCRQIYAFSEAGRRGWFAGGEAIAARGFARLLETAVPEAGARGCAHLIDDDGRVLDQTRDLYDQAFLLLACAARIRAGDSVAGQTAENALSFLDHELSSPHGGYFEDDRKSLPRRQNPHMHLFEALMALFDATGDESFLGRAREIERLFAARFLDRDAGVLREFFNDDWSLDAKRGDRIEAGHMMEWAFLLDRFERLTGENRDAVRYDLYRAAKLMAPPGGGFLPNTVTLRSPQPGARRLWPQTEFLRAALVMGGDHDEGSDDARWLVASLLETYLNQRTPGLWMDEYDADGRPIAKDVPASILYHLHEAVSSTAEWRHRLAR